VRERERESVCVFVCACALFETYLEKGANIGRSACGH